MKNDIHKMLEIMSKLNPDFILNEESFGEFNSSFEQDDNKNAHKIGDVNNYNMASQKAKTLANKSEKINTRIEFLEAFKTWFNTLGYSPEKKTITIATITTEIKKIMKEMGYN